MFCSQCGTRNDDSAKFCSSCGTSTAELTIAKATPPTKSVVSSQTYRGKTIREWSDGSSSVDGVEDRTFITKSGAEACVDALLAKDLQDSTSDIPKPKSLARAIALEAKKWTVIVLSVILIVWLFGYDRPFKSVVPWLSHLPVVSWLSRLLQTDPRERASAIVKQRVRSPGSFKNVKEDVLWVGKSKDGEFAYVVAVTYDAQNGFGALLRGCTIVAFHDAADKHLGWDPFFGALDVENRICSSSSTTSLERDYGIPMAKLNSFVSQ